MFGTPVAQVSKVTTRPAPIKGINSYDSLVAMPEGFAIVLRNFFAQPYGCQVRKGYRQHVVDLPGQVESVCSHNNSPPHLYAFVIDAAIAEMYDVTSPGVPGVLKLSGLTNARWQHVNHSNAAGVSLVAVNGADPLIWVKPNNTIAQVVAGDGSGNTISGVDPAALIHVYVHQKRLWFVEKGSTRGWYMPPDQVTGEARAFDFGPMWTLGGELSQIITWTIDDGNGADDHLVAISTMGQVSVYQGTDPEGADTWSLQGVYFAGAPVGRRAAARYGGDIIMLTQYGIMFLSDLLKSTKVNPSQENNAKYIQNLVAASIQLSGSRFGWQPFVFPGGNMTLINVPSSDTTAYQFAMNDITKAWSEFVGYNAYCWELHQQLPFFGSFGAVYRGWEGTTDDSSIDPVTGVIAQGRVIDSEAQTTFSYFESLGQQKHYKMVRPTILARGQFAIRFSVNTDFIFNSPLAPASFAGRDPSRWAVDHPPPYLPGEGVWNQSVWEGGLSTFKNWQSVTGIGTAASIRLLIRSSQETYWASVDWLYETGGVL